MNIFEQQNYKDIIKFYIGKSSKARGVYKNIAEYLGVHATLISQILSGEKEFTEEQIFSVCEFLGIPKLETEYLWILVQIERAGSIKLKDHYRNLKEKIRNESLSISKRVKKNRNLTEIEEAIFYSSWAYSAIQVITTLENQEVNFDFICSKINIPPAKIRQILDLLVSTQLVLEKDGVFKQGSNSTHLDRNSPFIIKHHTNWRLKAIEAIEKLSEEELMYSANFSISKKDFTKLREEMVQVIQVFLKTVKDSPGEDIAYFNLDFCWIKR